MKRSRLTHSLADWRRSRRCRWCSVLCGTFRVSINPAQPRECFPCSHPTRRCWSVSSLCWHVTRDVHTTGSNIPVLRAQPGGALAQGARGRCPRLHQRTGASRCTSVVAVRLCFGGRRAYEARVPGRACSLFATGVVPSRTTKMKETPPPASFLGPAPL